MGLFLFRFWPVLIPLLVYLVWFKVVERKAVKAGKPAPLFREGPWYWVVIATFGMAFLCFVWLGASIDNAKGKYVPPHMDAGVLVPGKVEEAP
jgi:hypothetical protein